MPARFKMASASMELEQAGVSKFEWGAIGYASHLELALAATIWCNQIGLMKIELMISGCIQIGSIGLN